MTRDELPTLDLTPADARPVLRRGSTGPAVRDLQTRLALEPDGVFGARTEAAVEGFQRRNGLAADRVVGPATWHALSGQTLPRPAEPPAIEAPPAFIQARNYYAGRKSRILHVVIHTMEAAKSLVTAENVAKWFAGPNAPMASCHYCIDADSVVQCVREEDTAFHAKQANATGIGLEHAGYAKQSSADWGDAYNSAMLSRSARLAARICKRHAIPVVHLTAAELVAGMPGFVGHNDCTRAFKVAGGHGDPGPSFPWARYLDMVHAALDS